MQGIEITPISAAIGLSVRGYQLGGGGGDVQLSQEQPSFSFSFCNFTAEYVKDMGSVPTSCVLDSLGKIWQC